MPKTNTYTVDGRTYQLVDTISAQHPTLKGQGIAKGWSLKEITNAKD